MDNCKIATGVAQQLQSGMLVQYVGMSGLSQSETDTFKFMSQCCGKERPKARSIHLSLSSMSWRAVLQFVDVKVESYGKSI